MGEDGNVWELKEGEKPYNIRHRAYYLAKEIVSYVKTCKYDRVFEGIFSQLVRSATSVGANLVEAQSGSSEKDWRKFVIIALKSANETLYWLCLVRDTLDAEKPKIAELIKETDEIARIIAAILLNNSRNRPL